jgi:uncharacterized integral membrane protein
MTIRTLLVSFVLLLLALFAAANWNAFMAPTTLSLLLTSIQAPLGLIMLGFTALLTALFLIFIAALQASLLVESRRQARELQAQRLLADQAETSRIAELRSYLEAGLPKLAEEIAASRGVMEERIDRLEQDLRSLIEQTGNSLAASLGELEDRLEREKTGRD